MELDEQQKKDIINAFHTGVNYSDTQDGTDIKVFLDITDIAYLTFLIKKDMSD